MDLVTHLEREFAHNSWANEEALRSLRGSPPPNALRYMSHIVAAEWLWIGRIKGWKETFPVWPEWTRDQCEAQGGKLPPLWKDYLKGMRPAGLSQQISYVNSKGESWNNSVGDILTHVLLHSSYHRGQIATDLRAAGLEPAYTDFIHAVREGFVR